VCAMGDPHRQSAMVRIKKELMVPHEALAQRVAELRAVVLEEQTAIEDQLTTLTQSQVLQARKAVTTLGRCATHVEGLQGAFAAVMAGVEGSAGAVEEYATLRQVHGTLSNIREARRWIDRFFNLEAEIEDLYEQIQEGRVLGAYKTIAELNAFKQAAYTTLVKDGQASPGGGGASGAAGGPGHPFRPYFVKINAVTNSLVDRVEGLFRTALDAFEIEGAPDQEAVFAALQVVIEEAEAPALVAPEGAPGLSRLRRDVVMESLLQGVNQKWDSLMAGADTAGKKLEAMTEFVETMSVWEFDLLPAFPSDWELKKWYSGVYHTRLVAHLKEHIAGTVAFQKLSAEEHMAAAQWIEKYVKALGSLEIDEESGLMAASDMRQLQEFAALFQTDAVHKMKQWIVAYGKTQTRDLLGYPVERDPDDGTLFSLGPVEFFKFLQTQLRTMSSISPPAVVQDVATCCMEGLRVYQESVIALMQLDRWKETKEEPKKEKGKDKDKERQKEKEREKEEEAAEEDPNDWREVRLKYLCAFINDTRRLDENTEQLLEAFQRRLPEDWHDRLSFEDVMCGFHDTATALLHLLSKHLTKDVLLEAWVGLFSKPRAAGEDFLQAEVTATLQDYLRDVDVWLDKFLLMRLHRFMVSDTVETYLSVMVAVRREYAAEWGAYLLTDTHVLRRFWGEYVADTDLERPLDPIACLAAVLAATDISALAAAVDRLFSHYADCSPFLLEGLTAARTDVDKKFKQEAVAIIQDHFDRFKSRGTTPPPSAFGALADLDAGMQKSIEKLVYRKDKKSKDKSGKKDKEGKEKKAKGGPSDAPASPVSGPAGREGVDGVEVRSLADLGIRLS